MKDYLLMQLVLIMIDLFCSIAATCFMITLTTLHALFIEKRVILTAVTIRLAKTEMPRCKSGLRFS